MSGSVRADKWLWAVRLFKTRGVAAEMCAAGKVKRRGHPIKAATVLHPGDLLEVPFPEGPGTQSIEMLQVIDQRVAAAEATQCLIDHTAAEVVTLREAWWQARREGLRGRPTKKDRRRLDSIQGFND